MALLQGKCVLITGAARGIGLAVADGLLASGANVMITDADEDALKTARETLAFAEGSALFAKMDVTEAPSINDVMSVLKERWGRLDGLVNNAAMLDGSDTQTVSEERFDQILNVNLKSAIRISQAALPLLRSGTDPSIVNMVSIQAFFGQPGNVAYAAAKGGLMNLTRAMAVDLGGEQIRVNAVAPGFIDTRMALLADGRHGHQTDEFKDFYIDRGRIPLRRPGTAGDCAGAFIFLLSDLSLYTTGQVIFVDGGLSATY